MTMSESEIKISGVCDDIKELLIHKNRKYGNSALKPCRVFSKSSPVEQLLVRIDDKLNRIMQGAGLLAEDEDVVNDLIGYLVLLKIGMHEEKMKNLPQVFHEGFKNVTIPPAHLKNIPQEDD
jgi:hypothetical protein|tara:strand:- start:114 stop:479 length:366 start_codon:yes stop_codon:yes gene_type:complete